MIRDYCATGLISSEVERMQVNLDRLDVLGPDTVPVEKG